MSAQALADIIGITKEGVLKWLRRLETDDQVQTTSKNRRSRFNKWEPTGKR